MESILRWLQSLARTTGSSDETETGQDLFLNARTTSGQLGLRGYVLWLAPTSLAPATARIRANQAGHWSCARQGRNPARSQSRRRSQRCVQCSAAITECPPFSCFEATKSQKKQWNSTFNTDRKKTRQGKRPFEEKNVPVNVFFPERSALSVTTQKAFIFQIRPRT